MRRELSRRAHRRGSLLPVLPIILLSLILAPYGSALAAPARGPTTAVVHAASTLTGQLTWNGANTNTAPTPASALSWSFGKIATAKFSWTGAAGGAGVSQAFLVVVYFGFAAYTKQQVETPPLPSAAGSINMTYDLTQFQWILQGLYQIHAYLEDPSGNSLWSETFYVKVTQSYDVVVATIGLLLITVIELYMIATVGPRAADKMRGRAPTPPEPAEAVEAPTDSSGTPPGST